jgi:hypothetical protein
MPQMPTYDNPTMGIAPVATPQAASLGPDAFGAGLAGGLDKVSQALDVMATHYDHAKVMAARNDLNQRMQDLAYNQEIDPDTGQPMGYLLRQGQAADGLEQEFRGDLLENLDDIKSGLDNDTQRAAFNQIAQKHIDAYSTAINEHEYKQKMAYNGELTKASVDLSLNSIAQDFQFPDLVSSHIDDGITALKSQAALNGISPDSPVLQDILTQYESSAHKTVIDSLIKTGQATTALQYFNEFDKGEPATDDQGNGIPGTEGSVFTKQDRETIISYLKPLADAQKVATAADTYYQQGGNIVDALSKAKEAFPDDPAMQQEFRQAVLGRASQYQAAVGETVKNSQNVIYQAMLKPENAGKTLDQLAQDPDVTDAVKTMTTYDAHSLSTIKDALNAQATKSQGDSLIQAIDQKLNDMTAAGQHPGASITRWPEFQALNEMDSERAKQLLEHEVGQQNADVQHRKSLALMDQQQQIIVQQQKQAKTFGQILGNPAALQTANPIGLRAIGAIDAEQASMLTELQKRNADQAKGQPVSWSADSINKTVKGLLGYKGTLSADQEQIVENGAASFGTYLFQREQAGGPMNPVQVQQAAQDWVKQPAMITSLMSNTATEVPLGEALKTPDRYLGTSDAYRQVYEVARKNNIPLTVGQARKAAAGVVAGGLR